jgi:hypothetical protein
MTNFSQKSDEKTEFLVELAQNENLVILKYYIFRKESGEILSLRRNHVTLLQKITTFLAATRTWHQKTQYLALL